ncbi:unnamed protein product, partial [Mesorhabditis spiculigera]
MPTREEIVAVIQEVYHRAAATKPYSFEESTQINKKCVEDVTAILVEKNPNYKYIITSAMFRLSGGDSGLGVSTVTYWEAGRDQTITYRWEGREMTAILNVFIVNHQAVDDQRNLQHYA